MYNLADVEVERPEKTSTKRFTGRHPQGVRFEEGRLCQPIYSLHHITDVEEEASLWRFEQIMLSKVNTDGLITFSDLFLYFAPLHLRRALKGNESDLFVSAWDNASDQDEVPEAKDVMACSKACLDHKSCIGWKFDDQGTCFRQPNMRIGSATAKPGFVSGWNLDRFRKMWEERPCR